VNRDELEHILDPRTFNPFVLTTKDGFAIAVEDPRNTLLGLGMIVIKHGGRLYQVPFGAIAHLSEKGEQLG
jgi:hypothetical protein